MVKEMTKIQIGNSLESGLKLLVFHATWCGPCRMYKSSLDTLSEKDNVEVIRVNVDEDKPFAKEMFVSSIPASFVYKDGKVVKEFVGYRPYEQLSEELKKL